MPFSHFKTGSNIWILKPTGLNRGKGIHVLNSISSIENSIFENCQLNQNTNNLF